jgi:hypothetical protein
MQIKKLWILLRQKIFQKQINKRYSINETSFQLLERGFINDIMVINLLLEDFLPQENP